MAPSQSHGRMQQALDWVWPYAEELFACSQVERRLIDAGVAVDPAAVRAEFDAVPGEVTQRATVRLPGRPPVGTMAGRADRQGVHPEQLGPLLTQMQSLAREHPEATW
jgi:ring-1,2-phenylacetyl-CoA epoxidase subunit PaaC